VVDRLKRGSAGESLSIRAYRAIRADIAELRLCPGEPLSEVQLAERFNYGRMPIRAAVNRLCHDGFLVAVSRKGIFVNPLRLEDVREIYEMLEALDGMSVRLGAQHATAADLVALEQAVAAEESAIVRGDFETEFRANRQFHEKLGSLARNRRIASTVDLLEEQVARATRLAARLREDEMGDIEEHRAIIQALKQGDPECASQAAAQHRQRVRDDILARLGRFNGVLSTY
jgi:GntR family transcriptional regulator, rspAB operon transcriptional repressor